MVQHRTALMSYVAVIPDEDCHARHALLVGSPSTAGGLTPLTTHWHQPWRRSASDWRGSTPGEPSPMAAAWAPPMVKRVIAKMSKNFMLMFVSEGRVGRRQFMEILQFTGVVVDVL